MSLKHLAQSSWMGMLEDLNKRKVTKDQNKSFKRFVYINNTDVLKLRDSLPAKAVASPQTFFCFVFTFFFSFSHFDNTTAHWRPTWCWETQNNDHWIIIHLSFADKCHHFLFAECLSIKLKQQQQQQKQYSPYSACEFCPLKEQIKTCWTPTKENIHIKLKKIKAWVFYLIPQKQGEGVVWLLKLSI